MQPQVLNASFMSLYDSSLRSLYKAFMTCGSLSQVIKEPHIIGLFCRKWPIKIRHFMGLDHPIESLWVKGSLYKKQHTQVHIDTTMNMHTLVHKRTHTRTCSCKYVRTYARTHTHTHARTYMHTHQVRCNSKIGFRISKHRSATSLSLSHTHIHTQNKCTNPPTHICKHTRVHKHTPTHPHKHANTHIPIRIHTHPHTCTLILKYKTHKHTQIDIHI